jgi:hypothetical protein
MNAATQIAHINCHQCSGPIVAQRRGGAVTIRGKIIVGHSNKWYAVCRDCACEVDITDAMIASWNSTLSSSNLTTGR